LPERHAFCGLCQALVTAKIGAESIKIFAESEGLLPAEISLEIERVAPPICPEVAESMPLDKFTMSAVFESRPDPLVALADDDQNSFIPVEFKHGALQLDFTDGWRIYRVKTEVAKSGNYAFRFVWASWNQAEVYVNGRLVYERGEHIGQTESAPFHLDGGVPLDIRFLLYAKDKKDEGGAGFADFIFMDKA
jgi:hypothetical protein